MNEWYEKLPNDCPPKDSHNPDGKKFYRLIKNNTPHTDDFISQKEINSEFKFTNISECIARSISIWENIDACKKIIKFPRHRNKKIAELNLNNDDGLILKTQGNHHFSWWRSKKFNINKIKVIE